MANKFVRIDNCAFTRVEALVKSARATADIENGTLVAVGGLLDGERELREYNTTIPAGATLVGIVCTPEVEADETGYHGVDTFVNKKGQEIRIGLLQTGDCFSIGNEASTDDITAGAMSIKHIATETNGRHTYQVYDVQ